MATPLVSVLMPVHNAERFLPAAVESVLHQDLGDFEFLVVDDGSTDSSLNILRAYGLRDARIRIVSLEKRGLIQALNIGLDQVRGEFLARMDADDLCLPERLSHQVTYLQTHPQVGVCGTWVRTMAGRRSWVRKYPTDHDTMLGWLVFVPPLAHSTVMLRLGVFREAGLRYDPAFRHAEDYELWSRAASVTRMANLPESLLCYRIHPAQVGQTQREAQDASTRWVWRAQLARLGISPTQKEMDLHAAVSTGIFRVNEGWLDLAHGWLQRLQRANAAGLACPEPEFSGVLAWRWFEVCLRSARLGLPAWRRYWGSPLSRAGRVEPKRKAFFALKCVLGAPMFQSR